MRIHSGLVASLSLAFTLLFAPAVFSAPAADFGDFGEAPAPAPAGTDDGFGDFDAPAAPAPEPESEPEPDADVDM